MTKNYSYRAEAHWTMHRRGIVEAESIPRTINYAAPPEFGGEPGLWTPEHLLVAAVATCYAATLRAVADASKLEFDDLRVSVEGTIERLEGGYRFTKITLRPVVKITSDDHRERMGRLLEKAEHSCLISRSLACTMILEPTIVVETPATV